MLPLLCRLPFGVFSGQHIFHQFRQQTFFLPTFSTNYFFLLLWRQTIFKKNSLGPPPPDIKWCVPHYIRDAPSEGCGYSFGWFHNFFSDFCGNNYFSHSFYPRCIPKSPTFIVGLDYRSSSRPTVSSLDRIAVSHYTSVEQGKVSYGKSKQQYLLDFKVIRYCFLALQGIINSTTRL